MRKKVDWILCAAGQGERLKALGLKTPKPALMLQNYSMLERAVMALPLAPQDQLIIVTLQRDRLKKRLLTKIQSLVPWCQVKWIEIAKPTRGQLETVACVKKHFRRNSALAIFNCDTFFKSEALQALMSNPKVEAVVPCGKLKGSSWSFFKTDRKGRVQKVAEKIRISSWTSVGLYYFRSQTLFLKLCQRCLQAPLPKGWSECYVSLIYDLYLERHKTVKVCPVEVFLPYGTMEQITSYWGLSQTDFKKQNI